MRRTGWQKDGAPLDLFPDQSAEPPIPTRICEICEESFEIAQMWDEPEPRICMRCLRDCRRRRSFLRVFLPSFRSRIVFLLVVLGAFLVILNHHLNRVRFEFSATKLSDLYIADPDQAVQQLLHQRILLRGEVNRVFEICEIASDSVARKQGSIVLQVGDIQCFFPDWESDQYQLIRHHKMRTRDRERLLRQAIGSEVRVLGYGSPTPFHLKNCTLVYDHGT